MQISHLKLVNFKNYAKAELSFCAKINCFTGLNGAGKTNILDALHYLSFTKSNFNHSDTLHIKKEEFFFVVEGKYSENGNTEQIICSFEKSKGKTIKRNGKKYQRYSEHIGKIPLVIISPDDSRLIIGSGEERRRFIDSVISQYDREYLNQLIKYNRVLSQRNKFLKSNAVHAESATETIDIYNLQLHEAASFIHRVRRDFINDLRPIFEHYYRFIAGDTETVHLKYNSHLHKKELYDLLSDNFEKDRILQYTYYGIHRDDIDLYINDFKINKSGSQGQQKTFLIALKLAQYDFIKQLSGKNPILLLDDIFDKFDAERVKKIIHLIKENSFGQIFITDTNSNRIHNILADTQTEYRLFEVENNAVNDLTEKHKYET
jgi:DNA replication and repair protein RecF